MRAVAYLRVSDLSQVDGHSLDAQERLFHETCRQRGWDASRVYREEGRSAHTDKIAKRPVFQRLLNDAARGQFDVVVVHTLDRWARNQKVLTETLAYLGQHNVGIASITENIDYSTPQGRLFTQMLGSFAEYFSGSLATHVKKGIGERALKGFHLGGIPFGYEACQPSEKASRRPCDPVHPGGLHLIETEADAAKALFRRYAKGTTTLAELAGWLNGQGLRTKDGNLFTTASVRGILHNNFYTGKVKHGAQVLPGAHETLISESLYQTVQATLKKNSGRSETLHARPARDYLLKGLIRCEDCGQPLWAQTLKSGNAYYREETGARSKVKCPVEGLTIRCAVPDGQMGAIIGALVLPDAWLDRVLARIQVEDEVKRIAAERDQTQQRLQRLGKAYVDGLYDAEGYQREKRALQEKLAGLIVPGVDAAKEAGKLLEDLPSLWSKANLSERRKLLMTMLDAVYVDLHTKQIVALRPKPAFRPLFEIAVMREASGITMSVPAPEATVTDVESATDSAPCFRWRRGRVELPVQRRSRWSASGLAGHLISP